MSDLATQQRELLQLLFVTPAEDATKIIATKAINTWARGLKVYKTNGHVLAQRALESAYPVVAQLLGADSMADLARALWHAQPPQRGDLAQWGDGLPGYLAASPQLQDEPYLADVARAEWALHCAATAPDGQPDPASLALMTWHDPDHLRLVLAPGCTVVRSRWPVASIVGAHLRGEPSLAAAGQALRAGIAQDVVVWREGLRTQFRATYAGESTFLGHLQSGVPLGPALDQSPGLDFAQWLPGAVASRLALGVVVQEPCA